MADDLTSLEAWVAGAILRLDRGQRGKLAKILARGLRKSQMERIATQRDPDGAAFRPRKPQLRDRIGGIRRGAMFKKLRTAKRLKVLQADASVVAVGFTGNNARIATVHQEGLRERLDRASVRYPVRRLLGITGTDSNRILDEVVAYMRLH